MLILLIAGSLTIAQSQTSVQTSAIGWQDWPVASTNEGSNKKQLVYIYTDWCSLCRKLEKEAFSNPEVQQFINAYFSPITLNAEYDQALTFAGEQFNYVREGNLSYHQLAAKLLDGKLAFPSLVLLDESQQVLQVIPGYQSNEHLMLILTYYGQDHYTTMPWTVFQRNYLREKLSEEERE